MHRWSLVSNLSLPIGLPVAEPETLCDGQPGRGLTLPAKRDDAPERPRLVLTPTDAQRYLVALQAERLGLAVALTYSVGRRPSEVAALRWSEVDTESATIRVVATHNVSRATKEIVRDRPKSKNGLRPLPLSPALVMWLQRHRERQRTERTAMDGIWTEPDEGLLFVRASDGGRLTNQQLYTVARRVAEHLGLGAIGPRVLRRSMLSQLAAAGVDKKVRAAIGGHTSEITDEHYREVARDEVNAAMDHIAAILSPLERPAEDGEL